MSKRIPFHSNAVWPPLALVILFAAAYGVIEAGRWLIDLMSHDAGSTEADMSDLNSIRLVVLVSAAVAYGFVRLWRFHPACKPAYCSWLEMSPWTARKPLPLGPIHLVWQDAVVLGVLAAVARWHAHGPSWVPPFGFAMAYLWGLTALLAVTRRWTACLLLGFLWPALLLPAARGWPQIAVGAAIIFVIWCGVRASLQAFPYGFSQSSANPMSQRPNSLLQMQMDVRIPILSSASFDTSSKAIGWPYLSLSPKVEIQSISVKTSFFLGLLFGWWTYCLCLVTDDAPSPGFVLFVSVLLGGIRLLAYCKTVVTPFNIWGRFATGRLIVPGFDRVFVTPLIAVLLAVFGAAYMRGLGEHLQAPAAACIIGLLWFVTFAGGPSLRNWLLTGQHRYGTPRLISAKQPMRQL